MNGEKWKNYHIIVGTDRCRRHKNTFFAFTDKNGHLNRQCVFKCMYTFDQK